MSNVTIRGYTGLSNEVFITQDDRLINLTKLLPISRIDIQCLAGNMVTAQITLIMPGLEILAKVTEINMESVGISKEVDMIRFKDGTYLAAEK